MLVALDGPRKVGHDILEYEVWVASMAEDEPDGEYVKIAFFVPTNGDEGITETMWAQPQGDGTYVLDNSPFEAYGISHKDRVAASYSDGMLYFERVVERGGHSTYRVQLNEGASHDVFLKYWPRLALLGCTYEGSGTGVKRLYSIDMPNASSVAQAYPYLQEIEDAGVWEFEEAHYFNPESPTA